MTAPPTIAALQHQIDDLRARIPPHLLLPAPLTGKAPAHIQALAQSAVMDGPAFPLTWPTGFSPYELCGLEYGRDAASGRPCWDLDILGSFYGDKNTFLIWTLRFFAPDVPMQILRVSKSVQHGKQGAGEGARYLVAFGVDGAWFLGITGFGPALGAEHVLSAQSLGQQLAALHEQVASLTKRVSELEASG